TYRYLTVWTDGYRKSIVGGMTTDELLELGRLRDLCRSGAARALRLAAGLSLGNVSDATGAPAPTIWRWETNSRQPLASSAATSYLSFLDALAARSRPRKKEGGGAH